MTGRRTTRATRQSAPAEQDTALPSPRRLMSLQPRHPIARRGTRRTTPMSRRSVSVDHLKSSGDIGYDVGDDNVLLEGDATPLASQIEDTGDAQEVLDRLEIALPRLIRACDEMHAIFTNLGSDEPTNRQSMELGYAKDGYDLVLERLGVSKEDDYVDISSFPWNQTSHLGTELPISPQDAAHRSNIVSLLSMVTDLSHGKRDMDELTFFENLDSGFPAYFTTADDPVTALDLAFRIRCHYFSSSLEGSDKPVLVAASIFCGEEFTNQTAARQRLTSGPYKPMFGIDVDSHEGAREYFETGMQAFLGQVLSGRSISVQAVQNSVEALLPQTKLLEDLRVWALEGYRQSSNQESTQEEAPPAADRLPNMTDDEDDVSDDSDSSEDSDGPIDILLGVGSTGNYMDGTATTLSGRVAATEPSVSPTMTAQRDIQNAFAEMDTTEMLGDAPYVASQPRRSAAPSHRQRQAANSDVDMAEPVASTGRSLDDGDHVTDDDDSDSDDEFEENTAPADQMRRVPTTQPARLSRLVPPSARQPPLKSTQPHARTSSGYIPPMQPTTTQDSISLSQMEELRNEAQSNRRTFTHKAEQRRRIPWSQTDEERLMVLIRDYNCMWSQIAEIGGFEVYRDQQAVRDKARNMKVVFLSTDQLLPEKFDKVALSKKEREAVRRAGRNPDRMEDDVDAYDRPTNTLDPGSE